MPVEESKPVRLATVSPVHKQRHQQSQSRRVSPRKAIGEPSEASEAADRAQAVSDPPAVSILGIKVNQLAGDAALETIERGSDAGAPQMLAYVNAHTLNLAVRDEALRHALNGCALVMNDGVGLSLAAKMRGERFPENLNGSDFTVRLLSLAASRGWGVFFLGAEPGIASAAAERLTKQVDGLTVAGTCHGFTGESDEQLAARVRESGARLLVVALGSPMQETWLDRNLLATGASIGVGVGAFLDFSAERVTRAPRWMNALGVEWCFRLLQEPGRLWRRYLVGNPLFLMRAWRDRRNVQPIDRQASAQQRSFGPVD
jgi:exopolysaccharide biosynthesis WecB/TagA/CpsF family protein